MHQVHLWVKCAWWLFEMDLEEIAERLVEERVRLGFSRAAFARLLSLSTEGLRLIEGGQSEFKVKVLVDAAATGVDVQYVLTGVKSLNANAVTERVGFENVTLSGNSGGSVGVAHPGSSVQIITTHYNSKAPSVASDADPGGIHISLEQRDELRALVNRVAKEEKKMTKPKSARAIWSALNRHCDVTTYSLIARGDFEKAKHFLMLWIGKLAAVSKG